MMELRVSVVILAAGAGSRLGQSVPKPWISVAGKPALAWLWETCAALGCSDVITVVHPSQKNFYEQEAQTYQGRWAYQIERRGTADAAYVGLALAQHERVLILNGDVPLLTPDMLRPLLSFERAILGFRSQTSGYGLIHAESGVASAIQEGATDPGLANAGVYVLPRAWARHHLPLIPAQGEKKEAWLTELVRIAYQEASPFQVVLAEEAWRCEGINTVPQWIELERSWRAWMSVYWGQRGVYLEDATSIGWSCDMAIAPGVRIGRGCVFEGRVVLESDVVLEPYCVIRESSIGPKSRIRAYSYLDHAHVGSSNKIGPYAHVQQSHCEARVELGNYVEVKRSRLGPSTKAKHLAYLGDAQTGWGVNVGAGAIVANYNGIAKSKTVLGDGVFVGSNVSLVAPLSVGAYAVLAAGSVVVSDVPESMLAVSRSDMKIRPHRLCSLLQERVKRAKAEPSG